MLNFSIQIIHIVVAVKKIERRQIVLFEIDRYIENYIVRKATNSSVGCANSE